MEKLSNLRSKIDGVDEKLINLFKERSEYVQEVGKIKKAELKNKSFIMQAREVDMIRNLIFKDSGAFPKETIAQIWRLIISASLRIEHEYNVVVCGNDCYIEAIKYFGSLIDINICNSIKDAFREIEEGRAEIAIINLKEDLSSFDLEKMGLKIFARLPFITHNRDISSYICAFANLENQPTKVDKSLYLVKADEPIKESEFNIIYNYSGNYFLIEFDGFVLPDNEKIARLMDKFNKVIFLGTYSPAIIF